MVKSAILLIYTGGTIGMKKDPVTQTLRPFDFSGILDEVPELQKFALKVDAYNRHKRSPFETFYVGGDGMSGYSSTYATETIGLRGYDNGSLTPNGYMGYAYDRFTLELRYPFMLGASTNIYGLMFAEGGNAWNSVKKFNPFDMKRSVGAGVRIFLPMVGMLGIDWAYGFDRYY